MRVVAHYRYFVRVRLTAGITREPSPRALSDPRCYRGDENAASERRERRETLDGARRDGPPSLAEREEAERGGKGERQRQSSRRNARDAGIKGCKRERSTPREGGGPEGRGAWQAAHEWGWKGLGFNVS
jgi:hypothetical protein